MDEADCLYCSAVDLSRSANQNDGPLVDTEHGVVFATSEEIAASQLRSSMANTRRAAHIEAYGLYRFAKGTKSFLQRNLLCLLAGAHPRYRVLMNLVKLRELYPALSEAELIEAAENLDRYLKLVCQIYEAMQPRNCEL